MSSNMMNNLVEHLTIPRLTKITKIFSGAAPAGTAIFRPLLLNREYKSKGMPDDQRRVLVLQEAIGQGLNLAVHLTSFIGTMVLTSRVLKGVGFDQKQLGMIEAIAANVGSFLGMSFIAPVVGGKVLNKWMMRGGKPAEDIPAAPIPRAATGPQYAPQLRRIGSPSSAVTPVQRPAFQSAQQYPQSRLTPSATYSPFQGMR